MSDRTSDGEVGVADRAGGPGVERADVGGLFGSTAAWTLDDRVVHTNHGSFGGVTRATQQAVEVARREFAANPMRAWTREFFERHARAVDAVAGLVGASPADTTLVANATIGMDVALRVLDWGPDATVVCTDQAYPSVAANLARRAAGTGARIVTVALDPGRPDDLYETLTARLEAVAGRGPVGLVVDQFVSATATPIDVHRVVGDAHARGVPVVVDAAHAPGQVAPADANPGADAWTGNLHKWACGPPSLAALVVDPCHHDRIGSVVSSWFDDEAFPANSRWQGTSDPGPLLVAEQVVDQARAILSRGNEIEARVVAGAGHVAESVGGQVLPGAGWMRGVVLPGRVGPADDATARAVERPLWEAGIEAKVTPAHLPDHPAGAALVLRLSAHAYTSADDHDRLADALATVLA